VYTSHRGSIEVPRTHCARLVKQTNARARALTSPARYSPARDESNRIVSDGTPAYADADQEKLDHVRAWGDPAGRACVRTYVRFEDAILVTGHHVQSVHCRATVSVHPCGRHSYVLPAPGRSFPRAATYTYGTDPARDDSITASSYLLVLDHERYTGTGLHY